MHSLSRHVLSCLHFSSFTSCSKTLLTADFVALISCWRCWRCAPSIWTACPCASSSSLLTTSVFSLWSCLLSTALQAVSVSCYLINPRCFFCLVLHHHSIHVVVSLFLSAYGSGRPPTLSTVAVFFSFFGLTFQAKMCTRHWRSAKVLCRGLVICFARHLSSSLGLRHTWKHTISQNTIKG